MIKTFKQKLPLLIARVGIIEFLERSMIELHGNITTNLTLPYLTHTFYQQVF